MTDNTINLLLQQAHLLSELAHDLLVQLENTGKGGSNAREAARILWLELAETVEGMTDALEGK